MLPDDFEWRPATQYSKQRVTLCLHGVEVARMVDRLDGSWYVMLERQRPLFAPDITRDCSSFETGRHGCETWAIRHEARLRAQIEGKRLKTCGAG